MLSDFFQGRGAFSGVDGRHRFSGGSPETRSTHSRSIGAGAASSLSCASRRHGRSRFLTVRLVRRGEGGRLEVVGGLTWPMTTHSGAVHRVQLRGRDGRCRAWSTKVCERRVRGMRRPRDDLGREDGFAKAATTAGADPPDRARECRRLLTLKTRRHGGELRLVGLDGPPANHTRPPGRRGGRHVHCPQQPVPSARVSSCSRCLPAKLKAPPLNARDGGVAIEEFQLAYEWIAGLKRPEGASSPGVRLGGGGGGGGGGEKAELRQLDAEMRQQIKREELDEAAVQPRVAEGRASPTQRADLQRHRRSERHAVAAVRRCRHDQALADRWFFDVNAPLAEGQPAVWTMCGGLTQAVAYFITPQAAERSGNDRRSSCRRACASCGARSSSTGSMDSLEETLEFWSPRRQAAARQLSARALPAEDHEIRRPGERVRPPRRRRAGRRRPPRPGTQPLTAGARRRDAAGARRRRRAAASYVAGDRRARTASRTRARSRPAS